MPLRLDGCCSNPIVSFFLCRKETCGHQLTVLSVLALKAALSVSPNSVYQSPAAPR